MHDPARIPFSKIAVCIGKAGDSRIYFTADLHFYHDHIIRLANRPYHYIKEMNEALVENWNRRICENDEVYSLGDVTMKNHVYAREMLKKRKGRKYLIEGNHDRFVHQKEFDQSIFTWVKQMHELKYAGHTFVLFHYPIAEWNGFYHGAIHLHGHQHNHAVVNYRNRDNGLLRYDVGVDANAMAPVSLQEIIAFFE